MFSPLMISVTATTHEQGLWTGIICSIVVQVVLLLLITLRTDWQKEVCGTKVQLLSFHAAVQY